MIDNDRKRLAIIFHSGSYDRIYNGLTLALTALSIGTSVKMLFTYWSLEYLKRDNPSVIYLNSEAEKYRSIIEKNMEQGHFEKISELFTLLKKLDGKIYVCVSSMTLLNITRDKLIDEVDESIGVPEFLMNTSEDQIMFI